MKQSPIIVLFNQDLRLADNPALTAAADRGVPLILLYVYAEKTPDQWRIGAAQKWWLHESLTSLQKDLSKFKQTLILRRGILNDTIREVAKETGASALYFNRRYEPWIKDFDEIETKSFNGSLLIEPWEVSTKTGDPFRVFTPFWKKALKILELRKPLPIPHLPPDMGNIYSEPLESWQLQPSHPDWAKGIREHWKPGEKEASKQMERFLSGKIRDYHNLRDFPNIVGTSKISPYLHLGEISPHQIWDKVQQNGEGELAFLSELGWREFSYHLLYHFPQIPTDNFNQKFDLFPWKSDKKALERWQMGQTGYPIVDAGMRELWHTGWIHRKGMQSSNTAGISLKKQGYEGSQAARYAR